MITSKQASQFVTDIYNPIQSNSFDFVIHDQGVTVGIKRLEGVTVFAFPGTENNQDFVRDIKSIEGWQKSDIGRVVKSFYKGIPLIYNKLFKHLFAAESIAITGHSLGASHAIYLALSCIKANIKVSSLDLFAPPISTDKKGVDTVLSNVDHVRVFRNGEDPVPFLPFEYPYQVNSPGQFPLIELYESPGWVMRWIDTYWHLMKFYTAGVAKIG